MLSSMYTVMLGGKPNMWHGEEYQGWCPVHGDKYMDNGFCMKCEQEEQDNEEKEECSEE